MELLAPLIMTNEEKNIFNKSMRVYSVTFYVVDSNIFATFRFGLRIYKEMLGI